MTCPRSYEIFDKGGKYVFFTLCGARAKKRRKDIFTVVRFSPLRVAALKVKKDKRGCGNYIGSFMLKKEKTRQRIRFYGARIKLFAVN